MVDGNNASTHNPMWTWWANGYYDDDDGGGGGGSLAL